MLSLMLLQNVVRMAGRRLTLFSRCRKWKSFAFLESAVTCKVQERCSVICTARNFVLLTLSTAVPFMVSCVWLAHGSLKSMITSFLFPYVLGKVVGGTLFVGAPLLCKLFHHTNEVSQSFVKQRCNPICILYLNMKSSQQRATHMNTLFESEFALNRCEPVIFVFPH